MSVVQSVDACSLIYSLLVDVIRARTPRDVSGGKIYQLVRILARDNKRKTKFHFNMQYLKKIDASITTRSGRTRARIARDEVDISFKQGGSIISPTNSLDSSGVYPLSKDKKSMHALTVFQTNNIYAIFVI
jgi:hypothetical protein